MILWSRFLAILVLSSTCSAVESLFSHILAEHRKGLAAQPIYLLHDLDPLLFAPLEEPLIQATRTISAFKRAATLGVISPAAPSLGSSGSASSASSALSKAYDQLTTNYLPSYTNSQQNWPAIGFDPNPTSYTSAPAPTVSSGSAPPGVLQDGVPVRYVIKSGETARYLLDGIQTNESYVYVTMNVCQEPNGLAESDKISQDSLTLYASTANDSKNWPFMDAILGFANITLLDVTTKTAYVDISAPDITVDDTISGDWTYEIAVSSTKPVHRVNIGPGMNLVDTDFAHALFVTENFNTFPNGSINENITDFGIFVYGDKDADNLIEITPSGSFVTRDNRLAWSYCGISDGPALLNQNNAWISTTTRGGPLKGQFFLNGLNRSSDYIAYLSRPNNISASIGSGGGEIYLGVNFTTKSETNCQLIYNMDFCSTVAYAAPGNASIFNPLNLSSFYDNLAQERYQNFSKSLDQIQCDADPAEIFSPIRSCDNCAEAYKQWLCAITIPRCTDNSKNASYLYSRPANSSRNPVINEVIRPGGYKEILPCIDLCYQLVQNCPADFQFICPKPNSKWSYTYGIISDDGDVSCSFPGALYYQSYGTKVKPALSMLAASFAIFITIYFA